METMQVEITEERLSSDGYNAVKGDRLTLPVNIGVMWCSRGWCVDVAEKVPTGERNINPVTINPKKISHKSAMETK